MPSDCGLPELSRLHVENGNKTAMNVMIKPEVLDALVAAGCTAEQLAAAVKADQARSSGAERQARFRAKHKALQSDERNVTSVTVTGEVSPKKETSPTPPKEKTTPSTSEAKASSSKARASATDSEFEDWYSRYPHKVQRGAAEKAFVAARKIASLEELIAGLHRYIGHKPEDRQWQNPATWLNGKGWLDEPAGPAIRNARWPIGPPRQAGVSGAAQRIIESEGNGSESIFGSDGNAQRLPTTGGSGPRNAAPDVPGGIGRQFITINH